MSNNNGAPAPKPPAPKPPYTFPCIFGFIVLAFFVVFFGVLAGKEAFWKNHEAGKQPIPDPPTTQHLVPAKAANDPCSMSPMDGRRSLAPCNMGADSFTDLELMTLLVSAATDVYDPGTFPADQAIGCGKDWLEVEGEAKRYQDKEANSAIQYTVYKIKKGAHKDKHILAFMGTNVNGNIKVAQIAQDNQMRTCGPDMKKAGENAVKTIEEVKPDFVTGHSLGGFLSELAFSNKPTDAGASFASPGTYGATCNFLAGGYCTPGKKCEFTSTPYQSKKFNVVINLKDQVARGYDVASTGSNHISNHIIWIDEGGGGDSGVCKGSTQADKMCAAGHSSKLYVEATTGSGGPLDGSGPGKYAEALFDKKQYSDGAPKCE